MIVDMFVIAFLFVVTLGAILAVIRWPDAADDPGVISRHRLTLQHIDRMERELGLAPARTPDEVRERGHHEHLVSILNDTGYDPDLDLITGSLEPPPPPWRYLADKYPSA